MLLHCFEWQPKILVCGVLSHLDDYEHLPGGFAVESSLFLCSTFPFPATPKRPPFVLGGSSQDLDTWVGPPPFISH